MWAFIEDNQLKNLIISPQPMFIDENCYSFQTWSSWSDSDLNNLGIFRASFVDLPATKFHRPGDVKTFEVIDTVVELTRHWIPWDISDAKSFAFAKLAAWRERKEEGGMIFEGMEIATDKITQGKMTAAYIKALSDPEYEISNWKIGPNQFIQLSNETILNIGTAMTTHIQECFDQEAIVSILIDQATTLEEIDNILNNLE